MLLDMHALVVKSGHTQQGRSEERLADQDSSSSLPDHTKPRCIPKYALGGIFFLGLEVYQLSTQHRGRRQWRRCAAASFSNIIKGHAKTSLSMPQVEKHVRPGLNSRIPPICTLLSAFFQERVSYFAINVLLLQGHLLRISSFGNDKVSTIPGEIELAFIPRSFSSMTYYGKVLSTSVGRG